MDDFQQLYAQVDAELDDIPFGELWPGFHRYEFALYTAEKVCLPDVVIDWDERFIGNTAVEYEGRFIAIWDVEHDFFNDPNRDISVLTAGLVHEMFHAFQQERGETRFPNDLKTLMYPHNLYNHQLKYAENTVLADAFEAAGAAEKTTLLNRFCGIRQRRMPLNGGAGDCELLSETAEGMAEYVGTLALKVLSPQAYVARSARYTEILRSMDAVQVDIRRISYYSGAVLLLTAHDAGIDFSHPIGTTKEVVYDIVTRSLAPVFPKELQPDVRIESLVAEATQTHAQAVEQFLSGNPSKIAGEFYISGYDPMNMIRSGDLVLCKTFVRLTGIVEQTSIPLMGETLLCMVPGSENKASGYYRQTNSATR